MSDLANMQTIETDFAEESGLRCPHLGISDDPDTCIAYPSDWNLCYKSRSPTAPRLEHQRSFCLSKGYTRCPVYLSQKVVALPRELKLSTPQNRTQISKRLLAALFGLLFLVFAVWVYWQFVQQDHMLPFLPQRNSFGLTLSVTPVITPTKTPVSLPQPTSTSKTISSTENLLPVVLPTEQLVCGYQLDIPFGTERHFIIHQVADGQSLTWIINHYSTTLNALEAVNYFIPKPVWVGYNLIIPQDQLDLNEYPTFQAVELNENDISIDDLAVKLSTDSVSLTKYNELDPGCRTFSGWLLVVKAKHQ
jgi:hypothetical protein